MGLGRRQRLFRRDSLPEDVESIADAKDDEYQRGILEARNPGERVDVPISPTAGERIKTQILNVIGRIEDGQGMTVTLVREPSPNKVPPAPFQNPVAVIEFGQGGMRTIVEIDIVNGAQVFIPASSIRVEAFNEPPLGYTVAPPTAPVGIGAFVDYLPPARRSKIYRTFGINSAAATTILIPKFASTLRVERVEFATGFTVEVLDPVGTVIYTIAVAGGARMEELDLAGEAYAVRITGAAGPFHAKAIFEIGL